MDGIKDAGVILNSKKYIPFSDGDNDNLDYIEYKSWLDAGNTPDPAD